MALIKNEVYLYAKIKGSSIPQPIDIIPQDIYTQEVVDALITIDDQLFYTNYRIIKSAKEITICYGDSLKMQFSENNPSCKINYKNSEKIRILSKDLDFMLTILDKGYFKVNNIKIPFDRNGVDSSNFDIENERKRLSFVKDIVRVLDMLGCSEDIDINDMTDGDWRNLERLTVAFLEKKPVKGLKKRFTTRYLLENWKIKICIISKAIRRKRHI